MVTQCEEGWQRQPLIEEKLVTVNQLCLIFNDGFQRTANECSMILADSMCFSCWIKTQKPEDMKLQTEVSLLFFPHPPLSSEEEKVSYASGRNSTFFVVKLISVWTYFV